MAGAAGYCAIKAGMDNFSRAVALEEAEGESGARIVSLAPGIIETQMQVRMRAADPARFPEHATFVGFKESGQLDTPEEAAAKVLRFLVRDDFGRETISDVRSV
jgi:NAD(P)-dependent dehydrogenase (short-subunit alcohol dehydrogenase family)